MPLYVLPSAPSIPARAGAGFIHTSGFCNFNGVVTCNFAFCCKFDGS